MLTLMKNLWFLIVILERLLSPFDSKEIKPVNPKENQLIGTITAIPTIHWKDWCWS